ncbi:protein zer-1 homolog [Tachysurus vachellii]|uniref:protein zer-1 homolog n=1 Tax=Tachysurus vachellii TaxID=175792 RepID=UPI00296AB378|nr:protein zer-1 homolog [Tachysurus vachellii]
MATKAGDDPESLMSLCTVFCLKNLRRTMCYMGERNQLCLRPDIFLPSEICDKLVHMYVELVHTDTEFEPQDGFFQLFSDPHSTRLSRLHLREDVVRDRDLKAISKQDLMELHLTDCIGLHQSLWTLCNFHNMLVSLSLFDCINIFPESSTDDEDDDNSSSSSSSSSSSTWLVKPT